MVVADTVSVALSQNPETTMTECVNDRHDVEARNGGREQARTTSWDLSCSPLTHCACLFVQPLSARIRRPHPSPRALHSHFPFGLLFRSGKMAARKRKVLQREREEGKKRERRLSSEREKEREKEARCGCRAWRRTAERKGRSKRGSREAASQPSAASTTATTRGKIDEMRLRRASRHSWGFPF